MIRAIVFDCFGVLYTGSRSYLFEQLAPARHAELRNIFSSADHGFISGDDGIRAIAELLERDGTELKQLLDRQLVRNDKMVALVRHLRAVGYRTALLSNVDSTLMDELFAPQEQAELFDAVVLSSRVGMVKPHPDIYEYTIQELGIYPQEALMIDDVERNVTGAHEVGMEGIVYHSYDQLMAELEERGIDA